MAASGHRRGQGGRVGVDLLAGALLGDRDQEAILVLAVEGLERQTRQDSVLGEPLDDAVRRLGKLKRELLEEGRAEAEPHARDLRERRRGVMRLGYRQLAHLPDAALAHDGY